MGTSGNAPLRILVVDDDDFVRRTLAAWLKAIGPYEVYQAGNAFEGLNIIHRLGTLDGMLVDVNMPGMDGIEFIRRVKTKDRSIVAVIITSYPSKQKILQAMKAGASDFLVKPFSFDQVSVSMERLLSERELLKENILLSEELKAKKALEAANRELEQKVREQAILFTITDTINKVKSTKEFYNTLIELACTLTQTERGLFWVINQEEPKMVLMAERGGHEPELESIDYLHSSLPYAQVARDGIPMFIPPLNPDHPDNFLIAFPLFIQKQIFGILAISRPKQKVVPKDDAMFMLRLLAAHATPTMENLLFYERVKSNLYSTLKTLVTTLEAKDPYAKTHSQRVTSISMKIAEEARCKDNELRALELAASLHDIGKVGIRDQILMKPERLTPQEYQAIKTHPIAGEKIIKKLGILTIEPKIIRHHHERWDGNGYPDGLKGGKIPKLARILAIADTFDAITSNRPYRKARDEEFAAKEIGKNAGTQFDPDLVQVFLNTFKQGGLREVWKT